MKTIQQLIEEAKADGVEEQHIRARVTEDMRTAIRNRMELTGPPNPAIMAGVGQEHLGALFAWLIVNVCMPLATDEESERVVNEFQQFRDFDIIARQYQTFLLGHSVDGEVVEG